MKKIQGKNIKRISTDYSNLFVVMDNGATYNIKPEDILGILQREDYTPVKTRKHTYLKSDVKPVLKEMTDEEVEAMNKALEEYRVDIRASYGLHRISGGFVSFDVTSYDNDNVYLKMKSGVQSDCQNDVEEKNCTMERDGWVIMD